MAYDTIGAGRQTICRLYFVEKEFLVTGKADRKQMNFSSVRD
jgi:hypothetical protein